MNAVSFSPSTGDAPARLDPVFVHARREALFILALWAACLIWTLGCSYLMGYNVEPEEISTIGGIPAWIVWGVGAPWLLATVVTVWFCFAFMVDDELGEAADEYDQVIEMPDGSDYE